MPTVDLSSDDTYHKAYRHDAYTLWHNVYRNEPKPPYCPQLIVHYCRFGLTPAAKSFAKHSIRKYGIENGDSVLLVGGGFGWVCESFRELLPDSVVNTTEISPWVHAHKDQDDHSYITKWVNDNTYDARSGFTERFYLSPTERNEWVERMVSPFCSVGLIDEDLLSASSRARVASNTPGGKYTYVITENLVPWLTAEELGEIDSHLVRLGDVVIHFTMYFTPGEAVFKASELNPNVVGENNFKRFVEREQLTRGIFVFNEF